MGRQQTTVGATSGITVNVLSISPVDADHAALERILRGAGKMLGAHSRWMLWPVRTLALLPGAWNRCPAPIVVSECELSPGTWRDVQDYLSKLPDPPLLIVTSL